MNTPSTVADTLDAGHTPGPLSVRQDDTWPYDFHIITADGTNIRTETPACWTSKWNGLDDMRDLRGVYGDERDQWQAALSRQRADLYLHAAAPELLDALDNLVIGIGRGWDLAGMVNVASAAIAKARGEVQP